MPKKMIRFTLEEIYNKMLILLRVTCAVVILLVLLIAISFIAETSPEALKQLIGQLVLASILIIIPALAPFTKFFRLKEEVKQDPKSILVQLIAILLLLSAMIYGIINSIKMILEWV